MGTVLYLIGLTLGNFAYQAFFTDSANWFQAADRSFFQCTAVLLYIFMFNTKENG